MDKAAFIHLVMEACRGDKSREKEGLSHGELVMQRCKAAREAVAVNVPNTALGYSSGSSIDRTLLRLPHDILKTVARGGTLSSFTIPVSAEETADSIRGCFYDTLQSEAMDPRLAGTPWHVDVIEITEQSYPQVWLDVKRKFGRHANQKAFNVTIVWSHEPLESDMDHNNNTPAC